MHPFLHITDTIQLPTYLVILSLTYSFCVGWVYWRAHRYDYDVGHALDLCLMVMLGGFFGARIVHVFYENPEYYRMYPWDVLKVWQGGFVFYGGFAGALLAAFAYIRIRNLDFWMWADFFTPVFIVGYALGRIACFFNGCCFGDLCDLPWAVEFNYPGLPTGARHPTQLYATFWELVISLPVYLLLRYKLTKITQKAPGVLFSAWLVCHGLGRLMMEHFRDDYRGEFILGLSISSWFSLGLIAVGLYFCVSKLRRLVQRPV